MTWTTFFKIVELRTKIVSVSTFLLATLSTAWLYGELPWVLVVFLLLAVLAIDMGTTAFNSFFDFEKGVDTSGTNQESDKVLVHQRIPTGYALLTALALFAFAAVLGLFLALWKGWPLLVLGGLSLLVGYRYSGGRVPISSTPWGEAFAGFFLGSVLWLVVSFTLAPAGTPSPVWDPQFWGLHFLHSLPSLLFIASILTVNNCCDREGDSAAGRKTLSLLLGPPADLLIVLLPLAAYVLTIALSLGGLLPFPLAFSSLAGLLFTVPLWRGMFQRGFSHQTKGPNMGAVSQTFLAYTLFSTLGWVAGLLLR
ncbi:MAG: prenyltransferase [Spirochaetales bacterium]